MVRCNIWKQRNEHQIKLLLITVESEKLFVWYSSNIVYVRLDLHLDWGRNVSHQAGIFAFRFRSKRKKNEFDDKYFGSVFGHCHSFWEVCPRRMLLKPKEAKQTWAVSSTSSQVKSAIPQGQETLSAKSDGSSNWVDHPRRLQISQHRRHPSFLFVLASPTTHKHQPGHHFAQNFDSCIPVAVACVGFRACARHPRRPKRDSIYGGAGRNNRPLTAAPWGGRGPSLASLVALGVGCSLTLVRNKFFSKTLFLDRTQKLGGFSLNTSPIKSSSVRGFLYMNVMEKVSR